MKTKLDKSLFEFSLFWSIADGSMIEIDTLISVYAQYSNTHNMKALVGLFGKQKVLDVINSSDDKHKIAHDINIEIINDTATRIYTANDSLPFTI